MLKAISSITNALGALNYKGTWNASTNSPALVSSVGTKGDYYVVSVAGSTNLNGETLWGVGDWAVFNGSAWQKVEGGNTINATTVIASTSVTTPIVQATNSSGLALKNSGGTTQLSVGAGGGDNVTLAVATSLTDNLIQGTAAKGVNFTANTPAAGMTSQLLNWYEEGNWTPVLSTTGTAPTISGYAAQVGKYTRVGNLVTVSCYIRATVTAIGTGDVQVTGLPFTVNANTFNGPSLGITNLLAVLGSYRYANPSSTNVIFEGSTLSLTPNTYLTFSVTYPV